MNQPLDFTLAVQDFDLYLLPEGSRDIHSEAFHLAVAEFYAEQFSALGGTAAVAFEDDTIHVSWVPGEDPQHPLDYAIARLRAGAHEEAIPLLEIMLQADPTNVDVLFNFGIAESDLSHLDRAIHLLERAVELDPKNADAWTALGFARQRNGQSEAALLAMQRAVEADPQNGLAQRNLGGMLGNLKRYTEAEPYLRAAARLMPGDQAALYGLARCLEQTGKPENETEADTLYKQVIAINPDSEIAEAAKQAQRRIAQKSFRANAGKNLRMDAVMYCLGALETFAKMDRQQVQAVAFEIATLGQRGLNVNNPDQKYRLRNLEGEFSGLHLVSIMYAGFKEISPETDIGFDLRDEYALARQMLHEKKSQS